jgi:hypothetical protein
MAAAAKPEAREESTAPERAKLVLISLIIVAADPRNAVDPRLPDRGVRADDRSRVSRTAPRRPLRRDGLSHDAYPTTLALITASWSGPARTRSIALWSALGRAIAALGPLLSRGAAHTVRLELGVRCHAAARGARALHGVALRPGARQRDDRSRRSHRRDHLGSSWWHRWCLRSTSRRCRQRDARARSRTRRARPLQSRSSSLRVEG